MQRDFFRCRDCSSSHNELQVHHCFYEKGDPWETDDCFLITLCENCHNQRHAKETAIKRAVSLAMAGMTREQMDEAVSISKTNCRTTSEDLLACITMAIARRNFEEAGI